MTSSADIVKRFEEVTGAKRDTAIFFLDSSGWDVQAATAMFYEMGGVVPRNAQNKNVSAGTKAPGRSTSNNRSTGRVVGFSDLAKGPESKEQTYFTGGAKSGMVVADPSKETSYVDNILENVRKQTSTNPVPVEEDDAEPSSFGGTGFKLGRGGPTRHTPSSSGSQQPKKVKCILTFYSDGFTVDDKPLRKYDDPANKSFLDDVTRGVVPRELERNAAGQFLSVDVVDKKKEQYKPPPFVLKPFSGHGRTLGSAVSSTTTQRSVSNSKPTKVSGTFRFDPAKPSTTLQIRLFNGKRVKQKFNLDHTTEDIRMFIDSQVSAPKPYRLQTPYPVTIIEDMKTLEQLGLRNAVVVQKMI